MKIEYYKSFIKKILKNKTTIPVVRKELSEEPFVSQYLERQWDKVSDEVENGQVCKGRIWEKVIQKCWGVNPPVKTRSIPVRWWSYSAAVVVLLILTGSWIYQLSQPSHVTLYAPKGITLSKILPDSSTIWLNSETTVRYAKNFKENRTIHLDGEAFFDVKKYEDNPFKVLFNDATVEVKGTSFNVKSYKQSVNEITLFTGKIDFQLAMSQEVIALHPSEQIIYNPATRAVTHAKAVSSDFDWRTGIFKFNDKRLDELVEDINRIYNVSVIISREAYNEYLFTGTIRRDEDLFDVIDKICITLDLHRRVKGDSIILY